MDHTGLIYVIGFGFAATTFVFGTILFSWLITHRRRRPQKGLPYESGVDTIGDTWSRFGLAFYLYALLFVAFGGIWGTGVFGAMTGGGFEDPDSESSQAAEVAA